MSNKRELKAYVRYDGTGRVIAGSLVLRHSKPKVGDWEEIEAYECCNEIIITTTTTTTVASTPFISVWRTTSTDESITLPYISYGSYAGTIDWGDGNTSISSYVNRTHTYAVAGDYTITISGINNGWSFGAQSADPVNSAKIRSVVQWGNKFSLGNIGGLNFSDCVNLDLSTVSDILNLSGITNITSMFFGCISLTTINRINEWNTEGVTYMNTVFQNATSFNQNISSWNVSNVISMYGMFSNAVSFNNGGSPDINNWNTSSVTNMDAMFAECAFNQPINNWNVSNVTSMVVMFRDIVGGISAFNQNIGSWNTSSVTNMTGMFQNATAFNQNLSGWCVTLIPSLPSAFDTGATAWVLPRPIWGTCPV